MIKVNFGNNRKLLNITVIGCGGTGSQFIPLLMQLLSNVKDRINLGTITLVDGDDYEEGNLANQKCTIDEVGMNKAEALAERYEYIFDNLKIQYVDDYIRTIKQLKSIVNTRGYNNIVIYCVDNNATRKLGHELFESTLEDRDSLISIDSGNGDIDRVGQVIVGYAERGEILSRPVASYFKEILDDSEDLTKMATCTREISEYPQNIATNVLAATILFCIVTNILTFGKIEKGIVYFDANKQTVISR